LAEWTHSADLKERRGRPRAVGENAVWEKTRAEKLVT